MSSNQKVLVNSLGVLAIKHSKNFSTGAKDVGIIGVDEMLAQKQKKK